MELSDKQMATVVLALTTTVETLTTRVGILEEDLKWAEKNADQYREQAEKSSSIESDLAFYRSENASLRSSLSVIREELAQERNRVYQANVSAQFRLLEIKEIRDLLFKNIPGFQKAAEFWNKNEKINAIKIMRETTGWGLREAKDAVERFCPMVCSCDCGQPKQ